MTDIVEFIRARVDEDEQVAHEASLANPGSAARQWTTAEVDEQSGQTGLWGKVWGIIPERVRGVVLARTIDIVPKVSTHIARHDPARVLREVEAKRRLLEEHHVREHRASWDEYVDICVTCRYDNGLDWYQFPCPTVRLLALPYADHPDYCEEWRP